MTEFTLIQWTLVGLIFIWSGFVRSGLGFGGAALALPLLLLVENNPLYFLPIISVQLLIFSSWIAWRGHVTNKRLAAQLNQAHQSNIDWAYLWRSLKILIIPKTLGVLGLLTLPPAWVTVIIFGMISVFALSYLLNRPFKSKSRAGDIALLSLGGYFSGTSLIGAPLIVAVFASHVDRTQLRDTLFVLWFILVVIKMASFVAAGVDLQWLGQIALFPCAFIGHLLGTKFHHYIQSKDQATFYRVIGAGLLAVCLIGVASSL